MNPSRSLKGLIFDLDGTLVDTAPDLLQATNHALSLIDCPAITPEQLRSFVWHGALVLFNPAPYQEVARRLGLDSRHTAMFGDSETDIRTAQNAGVPVIAVSFGYTARHVSHFNPTHVIDHYDEAWPIVKRML